MHLPSPPPPPPRKTASVNAVADSDAQTCLMGLQSLHKLGLRKEHLTKVTKLVFAANNEEISILGAVFLRLSGRGTGQVLETSAMVYVKDTASRFYLSRQVLVPTGHPGVRLPAGWLHCGRYRDTRRRS